MRIDVTSDDLSGIDIGVYDCERCPVRMAIQRVLLDNLTCRVFESDVEIGYVLAGTFRVLREVQLPIEVQRWITRLDFSPVSGDVAIVPISFELPIDELCGAGAIA